MDGSAFIFRGFYAFQNMQRSDGFPTNALFIVSRILLRFLGKQEPTFFSFVLDGKGPNFRHELYPLYKANRSATPEALVQQLAPIRRMVTSLGLQLEVSENCEADDCIASLAAKYSKERPVIIVSGDKDLKQCLAPNVFMWDPGAKEEKLVTLDDFQLETGLEPRQWPDVQALVGDTSDNIPGVPSIGPKTAAKIFADFDSLEDIRDRFDALPPKMQAKLEPHLEAMFLYRQLTKLDTNQCTGLSLEDFRIKPMVERDVTMMLQEFELRALARELVGLAKSGKVQVAMPTGEYVPTAPVAQRRLEAKKADAAQNGSVFASENIPLPWDVVPSENASSENASTEATPNQAPKSSTSTEVQGNLLDLAAPSRPKPEASSALEGQPAPTYSTNAQASLFGTETARVCNVVRTAQVRDLPSCTDAIVGFVPLLASKQGDAIMDFALAIHSPQDSHAEPKEYCYVGPLHAIVDYLSRARRLFIPDVKLLLRSDPVWANLPTSQCFDLGLATYLLDPEERDYAWPRLAAHWSAELGITIDNPALLALSMGTQLVARLHGASLHTLMETLEMPLVSVLAGIEENGIAVDKAAFADFLNEVQAELDRLTQELYTMAGRPFNIRSAQQLGDILFSTLDLPTAGKTQGGKASTSQEALEKLAHHHPIIGHILEYRKLDKLRSTYLEPLPQLAGLDGRIHTQLNQLATATGRLSSSNPNLQNIPVRGDLGRRMRSCFTATEGNLLVSADYSQVELRVLAHMSQDPTLLAAFRDGADIHRRTASLLFDIPAEDITADQRRNAKTINFGLVYGMGPQKLGQELHISTKEAKAFIERYFSKLQHLKEFYDSVEALAREQGYVTTMAGRRRLMPEMHAEAARQRSQARRQAINTLIQGSAADIIKLAMLEAYSDPVLRSLNASLILQVHDELLLEVPEANAQAAAERLAHLMASVKAGGVALDVPLLVDWGLGKDWGVAH